MNTPDPSIKLLIQKFVRGECSPDEAAWVQDFLNNHPGALERYMDEDWEQFSYSKDDASPQRKEVWKAVEQATQTDKVTLNQSHSQAWYNNQFWRVAAILLIVNAFALAVVYQQTGLQFSNEAENAVALVTKESGHDRRLITLPDGTQVWLNAYSKLTYPQEFSEPVRQVSLSGEAFFDVVRNPEQPFIIRTRELSTQVLGTSFNVMAYKGQSSLEVVVATGRVALYHGSEIDENWETASDLSSGLLLTPNERGVFRAEENQLVKDTVENVLFYTAWKQSVIIMENTSIRDAVRILSNKYNTKITLENDRLGNCTITGEFREQSLELILDMISTSVQGGYTIQSDQSILLTGKGC